MRTFFYRPLLRLMMLLPLLITAALDLVIMAMTALAVVGLMVDENEAWPSVLPDALGILVFLTGFTFFGILPHLIFPEVQTRESGFRIRTLVHQSKWFNWSEVSAVQEHWRSSPKLRMFGLSVRGLNPLFSLVGYSQLMGCRAFMIRSDLIGYKELAELLMVKCPHLQLRQVLFPEP
jgi:hypothetical protein